MVEWAIKIKTENYLLYSFFISTFVALKQTNK